MYDNPELRNTPIGVQPYVLVSPRLLMPPQRNLSMPLTKTPVYDAFWRFAAERQNIYMKRVQGLPRPWTDDPILDTYKFTNCYRASDRVSQYLIRNVIYRGDQSAKEVFFRTILFKMFNRIETWEWLNVELDEQLTEYDLPAGARPLCPPGTHPQQVSHLHLGLHDAVSAPRDGKHKVAGPSANPPDDV